MVDTKENQREDDSRPVLSSNHRLKPGTSSDTSFAAALIVGGGGLAVAGTAKLKGNQRLWDKYYDWAVTAEEYSPGRILRTFQVSNMLSTMTTQETVHFAPEMFQSNQFQLDHFRSLIGQKQGASATLIRLKEEGATLVDNILYWGKSEDIAMKYAYGMLNPAESEAHMAAAYAYSLGSKKENLGSFLGSEKPYKGMEGELADVVNPTTNHVDIKLANGKIKETSQIVFLTGGHTKEQVSGRMLGAIGTEQVSRFNRLMKMPLEIQPTKGLFNQFNELTSEHLGKKINLGVRQSGGLTMLKKFGIKYGAYGLAAGLAYKTADALVRNSHIFNMSSYSEGITSGLANAWAGLNIGASSVAETVGLHDLREGQEEAAAGSTQLSRLIGIPLTGAFTGAMGAYGWSTVKTLNHQIEHGEGALAGRLYSENQLKAYGYKGNLNKFARAVATEDGLFSQKGALGDFIRKVAKAPEADSLDGLISYKGIGKLTPAKLGAITGAAIGLLAVTPFILGALTPSDRPDELQKVYSGEKDTFVRKGRWWEAGASKWEGDVQGGYFKPHFVASTQQRAREYGIWGDKADRYSEVQKFYKKEFTYELERDHAESRPYPVSGSFGQDIPLVGPLIASTIGQLIKPSKMMHKSEWQNMTGGVVGSAPGFGSTGLNAEGEGAGSGEVVKGTSLGATVSQQTYRLTEMAGLTGFAATSVKDLITGTPDLQDQVPRLESARNMFGAESAYWDLEIGGGLATSESVRRLYPHSQNQVPKYNPLKNDQACLLPNTEVLTAENICIPAESIKVGDAVISQDGEIVFIEKVKKFKTNQTVSLSLYGDNLHTLDFSWNHPILMEDHKFLNANEVKKGDYVAFPRISYQGTSKTIDLTDHLIDVLSFSNKYIYYGAQENNFIEKEISENVNYEIEKIDTKILKKYPKIKGICKYRKTSTRPIKHLRFNRIWDINDFYYLLGVWAAEGSLCSKRNLSIKLPGRKDDKWEKKILTIFKKYNVNYYIAEPKEGKGRNYIVHIPHLYKILSTACPGHAREKFIINKFINRAIPKSAILELVKGLIDGGGWFFKTKGNRIRCGLTTTSKNLAYQVRNMLINTIGIAPALTIGTWKKKTSIRITCSGDDANILASILGYTLIPYQPKQKNLKYKKTSTHIYIKVKNVIIKNSPAIVIGHQVSGDSTYCVSLIATHNTWMPGAGGRGLNFKEGDPYRKIRSGESRLAGRGYEEISPELKGIDPEDYPDIYKYKILGDVASNSDEFKEVQTRMRKRYKNKDMTDDEARMYENVQDQIQFKRDGDEFHEYEVLNQGEKWGPSNGSSLLAAINEKTKSENKRGMLSSGLGGYWEKLSHGQETVLDQLTPFAPGAKFVHMRSAIEDYERTEIYGDKNKFWNAPYKNFIRPVINTAIQGLGFEGIPGEVEDQRQVKNYFDVLKYVKNDRLANEAYESGNFAAYDMFTQTKNESLYGLNPYTANSSNIYRALPAEDRKYFQAFSQADNQEERARILELVPENQKSLYAARWERELAIDASEMLESGELGWSARKEAEEVLEGYKAAAASEGFTRTDSLQKEYENTAKEEEDYGDWFRRTKVTPNLEVPDSDWIGWNAEVDLDDVKLKTITDMGMDKHDFNLWNSDSVGLAYKPQAQAAAAPVIRQLNTGYNAQDEIGSAIDGYGSVIRKVPNISYNKEDNIHIEHPRNMDWFTNIF